MAQLARTVDPTQRETPTLSEAVQARIPYASKGLRPKLDAWGRPIEKDGGVGPDIISPVYQSHQHGEAINDKAERAKITRTANLLKR